jgi:hypothetical protein
MYIWMNGEPKQNLPFQKLMGEKTPSLSCRLGQCLKPMLISAQPLHIAYVSDWGRTEVEKV